MHLPEQRHQERRLAGTRRAHDEIDLAAAEVHLIVNAQDKGAPARAARRHVGRRGGVSGPSEGRMPNADCVLMLFRSRRPREGNSFRRRFCELIDELSL